MNSIYPQIGISTLGVSAKGIGGTFKDTPEDFIVQELDANQKPASIEPDQTTIPTEYAEYVHFTLVKRDWHQEILLKNLAHFCGTSRKRFTYAGTKDKRALTAQRIAAWKVPPERLAQFKTKDCILGDFTPATAKLGLGDLWGNRFTIKLQGVQHPENLENILAEVKQLRGLPNFFGEQRFGNRVNNHRVGKAILQNNVEEAGRIFLTDNADLESLEEGKAARKALAENWGGYAEALKHFPRYARFEVALLNHLVQHPQDFVGAFKKLSKNLYKIFTHSYQSYLFNQLLSARIENKGSLEGSGRLLGYATENLTPEEAALLESEGFQLEDFKVKPFPEASVRGADRTWLAKLTLHEHTLEKNTLTLSFDLEKGSYATILLHILQQA